VHTDSSKAETLLIVDDEESILGMVSDYFGRRGYRVVTAGNGEDALGILERVPIDCCFTDINMPGMNGLDLAERIQARFSALPVIVMTGYPTLEATIQTVKNGVRDFLIKPFNLQDMEISLKRVLAQHSLYVENLMLREEIHGKKMLEQLNRELCQKIEELNTLNQILGSFATVDSTTDVFKRTVDLALDVIPADEARFFVSNPSAGRPRSVAASRRNRADGSIGCGPDPGAFDEDPPERSALCLDTFISGVFSEGVPLLVADDSGAGGLPPGVSSWMAVPVKIRDKVFGVLAAATNGGRSFSAKDLYYLNFTTQSAANSIETLALYENTYDNLFATLYAFVKALEARDLYTRQHSSRVTGIALVLGRVLGCTSDELDTLRFAGYLHDIGKIGIRDAILLKPGRLSADEFEKIKEHPIIGAEILNQLGLWDRERQIIRCHHERFDGKGYPDGLQREEIPFLARILAVADAYDAMASDRAYRKRMDEELVLKNIREGAGTQFDPRIVGAFLGAYLELKVAFSATAD
jgi:putative nucleotidyltransferase with HDIG domain